MGIRPEAEPRHECAKGGKCTAYQFELLRLGPLPEKEAHVRTAWSVDYDPQGAALEIAEGA